jgi:hypothetical protein
MTAVQMRRLLGRMFGMLAGMQTMTMREVRMVAGCLVIARLGMLRCFAMMLRGRIEVLGCFVVMVMNFVLIAHGSLRYLLRGSLHDRSEPVHDSEKQCHLRDPRRGIGRRVPLKASTKFSPDTTLRYDFDGRPVLTASTAEIAASRRFEVAPSSSSRPARSTSLFFTDTPASRHFCLRAAIFS